MAINGRDVSFWPAPLRRAVDSIAVMRMQVYMIARGRAAASASPTVKILAGRDEEAWKLAIREREIGVWVRRSKSYRRRCSEILPGGSASEPVRRGYRNHTISTTRAETAREIVMRKSNANTERTLPVTATHGEDSGVRERIEMGGPRQYTRNRVSGPGVLQSHNSR